VFPGFGLQRRAGDAQRVLCHAQCALVLLAHVDQYGTGLQPGQGLRWREFTDAHGAIIRRFAEA
jgi:hypothetical protein